MFCFARRIKPQDDGTNDVLGIFSFGEVILCQDSARPLLVLIKGSSLNQRSIFNIVQKQKVLNNSTSVLYTVYFHQGLCPHLHFQHEHGLSAAFQQNYILLLSPTSLSSTAASSASPAAISTTSSLHPPCTTSSTSNLQAGHVTVSSSLAAAVYVFVPHILSLQTARTCPSRCVVGGFAWSAAIDRCRGVIDIRRGINGTRC